MTIRPSIQIPRFLPQISSPSSSPSPPHSSSALNMLRDHLILLLLINENHQYFSITIILFFTPTTHSNLKPGTMDSQWYLGQEWEGEEWGRESAGRSGGVRQTDYNHGAWSSNNLVQILALLPSSLLSWSIYLTLPNLISSVLKWR